jgi:16S rRNA (guanine(966)-N(2))-methyltransferase RsmD
MLKVISGEYRGRVLKTVSGLETRPLLGQVREALFNILGERVADAEVWDLFAGTGANGIEALSRGARRVIFVEKANRALSVLRGNLDALGHEAKVRSHVLRADAWDPPPCCPEGEEREVPPDLVLLDPPYDQVAQDPVRSAYRARQLLDRVAPGGVLCFHFMEGHLDRDDFDPGLTIDLRQWGRSMVALIEAPGPAAPDATPIDPA